MSVTLTLEDEIDASRGDLIVHARNVPRVQSVFEAMVVWMAERPMELSRTYVVKHTARTTKAAIQRIEYRVDVNTLHRLDPTPLQLNEIGRVVLQTTQRLFIDPYSKNRYTGSFILVDAESNDTVAAGMIIDRLPESELRPALAAPRATNIRIEQNAVSRADRERRLGQVACTVWLTGLSGSGKSAIARELERRLHTAGRHVFVLDGDNVRFGLNRDLGFSKRDRAENIRRIAEVARLFNDAGTIVLVPVISPFRQDREIARDIIGSEHFLEVHVSTPIDVCESRDVKGLYRKARAGEIDEFTGISSPYEPPERPFLTVDTSETSLDVCVDRLLGAIGSTFGVHR
jgi:bifunctional enzyme CysN/CysC